MYKTIGTPNIIRIIEWRSLFEYLNPEVGEKRLDVACGGGALSLKIAEKGCEVYGVDLSEDAIKHAKCRSKRERNTM